MKKLLVLLTMMLLTSALVFGATDFSTLITFEIVSSTSASIAYQSPCSATEFACRTTTSTLAEINITDTSGTECQTTANYALRVTNDGTENLEVNMTLNATAPTGVTLKYNNQSYDYSNAYTLSTTIVVVNSSLSPGSNLDMWYWCDFSNYNSGAAITETRSIYHNVTAT